MGEIPGVFPAFRFCKRIVSREGRLVCIYSDFVSGFREDFMSIKFIHAADLHIDSPMKGLSEKDDAVAKKVREATRTAFKNLVDFAIDHKVAFVIIAGDVFDGDWDNVATGRWTGDQFKRLEREGVPVFITFGNHDVKNKIVRNMGKTVFPKNVYIFPSTAPTRKTYVDWPPTSASHRRTELFQLVLP